MFAQDDLGTLVNQLIRHYFDAKEDYRLAASRATQEQVKVQLTECVNEREAFHMALQQLISEADKEMSDNGTMAADLKRDWERLRGSVAGDGFESALNLAHKSDANAAETAQKILSHKPHDRLRLLIAEQHEKLSRQKKQ
jgi:uncharacterized protein (TIGR02284 family)